MAWTTTDLLADVRRRAMLPSASTQGTTDADLLEYANNEMFTNLVPLVMSANEEFFVMTSDVSLVGGQGAYRMPNRSAGSKLRDVNYIMGAALLNLARIEPEQLTQFVLSASGMPAGFYLEAGTVNLVPRPTSPGTLRVKWFTRPGRLTKTAADYAVIQAVAYSGGNTVKVSVATGFSVASQTLDVIAFRPPFEYLVVDGASSVAVNTDINGNPSFTVDTWTLTVSSPTTPAPDLSPNIAVGDYLCVSDKSPLMQIPVEMHSLLAQRIVCAVMESYGYQERWAQAQQVADRMEQRALKMIQPRVDGAPKKMRGILNTHTRFGPGLR